MIQKSFTFKSDRSFWPTHVSLILPPSFLEQLTIRVSCLQPAGRVNHALCFHSCQVEGGKLVSLKAQTSTWGLTPANLLPQRPPPIITPTELDQFLPPYYIIPPASISFNTLYSNTSRKKHLYSLSLLPHFSLSSTHSN